MKIHVFEVIYLVKNNNKMIAKETVKLGDRHHIIATIM